MITLGAQIVSDTYPYSTCMYELIGVFPDRNLGRCVLQVSGLSPLSIHVYYVRLHTTVPGTEPGSSFNR